MTTSSLLGLYHGLLVAYVLAIVCLNLIAYLISDFYRKKFNQPAPRVGFMTAIILGALIAVLQVFRGNSAPSVEIAQNLLLFATGVVSLFSAVGLYVTMKKERK